MGIVRRRRLRPIRIAVITAMVGAALFAPPRAAEAATSTGVTALAMAEAISAQPGLVSNAAFEPLASPIAVGVSDDLVGGMPRHGSTFGIMSSGDASLLTSPNVSDSSGVSLGTGPLRGNSDFDVTVLRLDLNVPSGVNCLSFDFRFLSEEFPEYVGTSFNDAFLAEVLVAELGQSTWSTSGSSISAPDNFAFDPEGNPITINAAGVTSMTSSEAVGTTFDGATPLLVASSPVSPGAHPLYLSIFDQGDHAYDSSVLVDNLHTFNAPTGGCKPGAGLAGNREPVWTDFHRGDVHVHAAGDTHLGIHPRCTDHNEAECAQYMVQNTLDRAKRFGAKWLIFTEHAPWLGFQRGEDFEIYNADQAERQWNYIKDALDDQSRSEIRGLLGSELGTAVPACTDVDVDLGFHKPRFTFNSPGHFGVYSTTSFIDDSMIDCNETGENGYVDDTEEAGGWGGINHPDNHDGGSVWHCYSTRVVDGQEEGRERQPQLRRFEQCPLGIDRYGVKSETETGSFRTIEVINADNVPSVKTLSTWDMFLQNGFRVAAVGGGDGHTAPRGRDLLAAFNCMNQIPVTDVGECIDKGAKLKDANHNKVGGSGRTVALYPASESVVGAGYDSLNPNDPARRSILNGSTTATNGPVATAQVNGQFPGARVALPGSDPVEVRVDWQSAWSSVGDTISNANSSEIPDNEFDLIPIEGQKSVPFTNETPDRIVVVTAATDGCGWNRFHCDDSVNRKVINISNGTTTASGVTLSSDHADVLIDPASDGYVRVELYWDVANDGADFANDENDHDDSDEPRFYNDREYDFAAVTSPIFLNRISQATIQGQVVDGPTGNPVSGAAVELCRTTGTPVCVTRTTRPDGTWIPIVSQAGTWTARAFPPAGVTNRGEASLSLGAVAANSTRTITLTLPEQSTPPYIDPSGVVVDTSGNPVEGATVVLSASETIDGPFTALPDGSAVMSPANRVNPWTTPAEGTFAWDVLAGWYEVTASKPGCVSADGAPQAATGPLQVPPPALNLKLVLDCRVPDTTDPTLSIDSAPPVFVESSDATVAFSAADASPVSTMCFVDGGPFVDIDGGVDEGVDVCTSSFTATGLADGPHTITVLAVDDRDNHTHQTVSFTVDTTGPVITVHGVVEGQQYSPADPPTPSCTAVDAGAGLAGPCSGVTTAPEGGVGTWSYTASATDLVGHTTVANVTWQVGELFDFAGFFSPVPPAPDVLSAKAGQSIPVKFSLGGFEGLSVIAATYPKSGRIACDAGVDAVELSDTATPGSSGLSYDHDTQEYVYIWKTSKSWAGTCRRFTLKLTDGTYHRFDVTLR